VFFETIDARCKHEKIRTFVGIPILKHLNKTHTQSAVKQMLV